MSASVLYMSMSLDGYIAGPSDEPGNPGGDGFDRLVLLSQLADVQTFTLTTSGLPGKTYTGISRARADGNNARVWGGMHYPSTVAVSDAVGQAIAEYVNANSMQSLRDQQERARRK